MPGRVDTVHRAWDAEAAVWVAASDDAPGLATGADTLDALVDKLKVVIPNCSKRTARSRPIIRALCLTART